MAQPVVQNSSFGLVHTFSHVKHLGVLLGQFFVFFVKYKYVIGYSQSTGPGDIIMAKNGAVVYAQVGIR